MQKVGVVTAEGPFITFGAEFVPFCSRVFFPNEMTSIYTSPEDLQDEEFIKVSKNIYEAGSTEKRVDLLDHFFLKRLALFPEGDINMERLSDVFDNMVPATSVVFLLPNSLGMVKNLPRPLDRNSVV